MKIFAKKPNAYHCPLLGESMCDTCRSKEHTCTIGEHAVHVGQSKAFIDMCCIPPHHARELQSRGDLKRIMLNEHVVMVFTTEQENKRETRMRERFLNRGIGCRLFDTVSLKDHVDNKSEHCMQYWQHLVNNINTMYSCKGHGMFKRLFETGKAMCRYEEYAGQSVDEFQNVDVKREEEAVQVVLNMEYFIDAFMGMQDSYPDGHFDLHGGNITYSTSKHKFCIVDYGYMHDIEKQKTELGKLAQCTISSDIVPLVFTFADSDPTESKHDVYQRMRNLELYPPEITIFVALSMDLSHDKQSTSWACGQMHMAREFHACREVFDRTRTYEYSQPGPEDVAKHTVAYLHDLETRHPGVNLVFYVDQHQFARTMSRFMRNWFGVNGKYIREAENVHVLRAFERKRGELERILRDTLCLRAAVEVVHKMS